MLWVSGVKSRTLYLVKPCRDSTHSQRDLKEKQEREKDYVSIMKARGRGGGGVGNPRGLTVYVVTEPRDGRVRLNLGLHPGRPVAM